MTGSKHTHTRIALCSIFMAMLVLVIKLFAWWLTGSVALYSDALESTINVATALIVWQAVRISARPADSNHLYGHHKVEYFSAVISGILILLAAILILREAWHSLLNSPPLNLDGGGISLALLATIINLIWARYLIRKSTDLRSPALAADGRHIMSDVWTSVGAICGLAVVYFTGWRSLDAVMSILIAFNILREGIKIIRTSIDGLMDKALDEEESRLISSTIVASAAGAIEMHDLRTRSAGAIRFADFHLVVDGQMSVAESHRICDCIERELQEAMPGLQVTIHVEPENKMKDANSLPIETPRE